MKAPQNVRFNLFGRFTIRVDDVEIEYPEAAFFTYLKLVLLSGESLLADVEVHPNGYVEKNVRDPINKGNAPPRADQGGYFDFSAKTGLRLRFRKGIGFELLGDWSSDLIEFEEVWTERKTRPENDLRSALELFGVGVNIKSWPKDRVFIEAQEWIHSRLRQLQSRRDDIQSELEERHAEQPSEPIGFRIDEDRSGGWNNEEESRYETSGFRDDEVEPGTEGSVSAGLGEALREDSSWATNDHESKGECPTSAEGSADQGKLPVEVRGDSEGVPEPAIHVDNSGRENKQLDEQHERIVLPFAPARRTISPLGIVAILILGVVLIIVGYLIGTAGRS